MKKLVESFGLHNVIAIIIMITGALLFVLTPFFLSLLDFDSNLFGVMVFLVGLVMFLVGLTLKWFKRRKPAGKD